MREWATVHTAPTESYRPLCEEDLEGFLYLVRGCHGFFDDLTESLTHPTRIFVKTPSLKKSRRKEDCSKFQSSPHAVRSTNFSVSSEKVVIMDDIYSNK
jgi:hypothetical protein